MAETTPTRETATRRDGGQGRPRPGVSQPLLGVVLATLGLTSLALAWRATPPALAPPAVALALVLAAAVVAAKLAPVHLARSVKLSLQPLPLVLLVASAPPPLAAAAAGLALLLGEFAHRRAKGSRPSDIASAVGRWTLVALLAGLVAHLRPAPPAPAALRDLVAALPVALAAATLYVGDTLTVALELVAATGEAPARLARLLVREGGAAEGALYLGGVLGVVLARHDAWALALLLPPALLLRRLLRRTLELQDRTRSLLATLADTVDLRDPHTGGHSRRVTAYTEAALAALDVRGPEATLIVAAARVHDLGKIATPDAVLGKPGPLDDAEHAAMRAHAARGAAFLERYPDFHRGAAIVRHHHERLDGLGYPDGLRGDAIPFGARVIAVADSFDAMTSDRPYRAGLPPAVAAQRLAAGRGTQWDPAVVDAFLAHVVPPPPSRPRGDGAPRGTISPVSRRDRARSRGTAAKLSPPHAAPRRPPRPRPVPHPADRGIVPGHAVRYPGDTDAAYSVYIAVRARTATCGRRAEGGGRGQVTGRPGPRPRPRDTDGTREGAMEGAPAGALDWTAAQALRRRVEATPGFAVQRVRRLHSSPWCELTVEDRRTGAPVALRTIATWEAYLAAHPPAADGPDA
jgi:HD-GYP domain-containing protein (c-di-GMP phosphodiesterase class II)